MMLFRGEDKRKWDKPEIRLMNGMTVYMPLKPNTVQNCWNELKTWLKKEAGDTLGGKVAALGQTLRQSGKPNALATAWTHNGSFLSDFNYVLSFPQVYLFYWGGTIDNPDIGNVCLFTQPSDVNEFFIVLDNQEISNSTILGFGHKAGTNEITFFQDLPLNSIVSCNGKLISSLVLKKQVNLDFDERIQYRKYIRP